MLCAKASYEIIELSHYMKLSCRKSWKKM